MANFGISMPDELQTQLDKIANDWYCNRSQALTRIFLEWKLTKQDAHPTAPAPARTGQQPQPTTKAA